NWILGANYPQAEAYSPIRQAEHYFLIATIAGIIAVFFIISFIIKYLTKPLELFTRHVEDLPQKTGDERFLDIKTKDEIGTLSLAFNKMVTEIDKRSALQRSEELYRTVIEFSTDLVYWRAPDNKIIYVSENCEKFCGYTEEEFYASPELLETMIHPEDRNIWSEHTRDIESKSVCEQLELRIVTKSGQVRWISHNCLPVYDKKGNYQGRRAIHQDTTVHKQFEEALIRSYMQLDRRVEERTNELSIANAALQTEIYERKLAEASLRDSEERLSLALKAAGQSIFDSDLKTGEIIISPEYALMLGYDPAEFHETTTKWIDRLHPDDKELIVAVYRAYIKGEIPEYKVEFRQKTKDGGWKWILSLGEIIKRDADGNPLRMIGTHTDITERKQAEEKIRHLATHDALTNLPSLRLAKDRILMALELAKRNKKLAAIMYLDLDGFKDVNDNYGHDAGDILLKEVGKRLLSCVRKVDTVARIGGDEFLLILTELQSTECAALIAKRALQLMSQPFDLYGRLATVGASIGIAFYPDHGDDADSLIRLADEAMYVIKHSGKNGYTFVNPAK
ncbi:MAG: diguanylate cyclase domain-containing protein, partial [Dissulfurispiraceae bacterium]